MTRIIEHKWFEFGKDRCGDNLTKTAISYEYLSERKSDDEPLYPVNDNNNSTLYQLYKTLTEKETDAFLGGRLGEY